MVSADTPVVITMKALVVALFTMAGIVVAGAGALWGAFALSMGHVRDDVGAIRRSLDSTANRSRDSDVKFTEQIGGLRNDLTTFSARFDNVASKLETSVNGLSGRMEKFESSVNALSSRIDKFQMELASAQNTWNDPKRADALAEALKQRLGGDQSIIVVPAR
jgi:methyl-accepting chemotaxis protein